MVRVTVLLLPVELALDGLGSLDSLDHLLDLVNALIVAASPADRLHAWPRALEGLRTRSISGLQTVLQKNRWLLDVL